MLHTSKHNKLNFSIFTLCTADYKEAADLVLPTWSQLPNVDNIVLYTDFDYITTIPKVHILNKIDTATPWLKIVGLRVIALQDFLININCSRFCHLDIDCYVLEDFSEVFNRDFDIAATRMQKRKPANAGVWFCKNTPSIKQFATEWEQLQEKHLKRGIGLIPYKSAYDQISFSKILHRELDTFTYLNVCSLPAAIYNSEHDNHIAWQTAVKKQRPKILHFKNHTWQQRELVRELIK